MVDNCKMKDISSHSAGVLAAVCFPGSVSSRLEKLGKCEMATCVEEYNIEEVYFLTCKLSKPALFELHTLQPNPHAQT